MEPGDLASVYESTLGVPAGTLGPVESQEIREMILGIRSNPSPKIPVVTHAILRALESPSAPILQKWFWPQGRPFCVCLSHDVDEVRWSWRRRLLMAALHPRTLRERNERYWNFDVIMDLERQYGVRSSWYFVANGSHPRDPPYRLSEVTDVMLDLERKGNEVGVHGSFLSYRDGRLLRKEREAISTVLGHPVTGIRQHYVNFETPLTWQLQEDAGFSYDATLTSNRVSGFRLGLCHPLRPPGRRILELPLVLGDWQLFWYEQFGQTQAIENSERLAKAVAAQNGLLTLNWHQQTYDDYSFRGWWRVYEHLVPWLSNQGPIFMTGDEVWRWWTAREDVSIALRERGGTQESWEVQSPANLRGLALRMVGAPSAEFEVDVPHTTITDGRGHLLVLSELQADVPTRVTVEW